MNAKQMNVKNLRVIVISAAIVFIAAILGVAIASCGRSPEASAKMTLRFPIRRKKL